ncbi:hypothetical protein [Streptomyces collinus]
MHTGLRITAFAAALAATFGTAYGVGAGVDPIVADSAPAPHEKHGERDAPGGPDEPSSRPEEGDGHGAHESAPAGGLQISEGGYTLDLATPRVTAGQRTELRFTYRLFLDFRHRGEVHTAAFTVRAGSAPDTTESAPAATPEHTDGHGH